MIKCLCLTCTAWKNKKCTSEDHSQEQFSMNHWICPRPIAASPIGKCFHLTGRELITTQNKQKFLNLKHHSTKFKILEFINQERHSLPAPAATCTAECCTFAPLPSCHYQYWCHPAKKTQTPPDQSCHQTQCITWNCHGTKKQARHWIGGYSQGGRRNNRCPQPLHACEYVTTSQGQRRTSQGN